MVKPLAQFRVAPRCTSAARHHRARHRDDFTATGKAPSCIDVFGLSAMQMNLRGRGDDFFRGSRRLPLPLDHVQRVVHSVGAVVDTPATRQRWRVVHRDAGHFSRAVEASELDTQPSMRALMRASSSIKKFTRVGAHADDAVVGHQSSVLRPRRVFLSSVVRVLRGVSPWKSSIAGIIPYSLVQPGLIRHTARRRALSSRSIVASFRWFCLDVHFVHCARSVA